MSEAKEYRIGDFEIPKGMTLLQMLEYIAQQRTFADLESYHDAFLDLTHLGTHALRLYKEESPFAEWAGVPVNSSNMNSCPLFVLNTSHHIPDTIMFSPNAGGRYKVCISNDAIKVNGKIMYVRDIAHLCDVIIALDPAAFEKGGEG